MRKRKASVVGSYVGVVAQLGHFLWARKLWWLVPIIVSLLMVGLLVVLASSSPVSPFIYTLF
jgi:hypothetical protein